MLDLKLMAKGQVTTMVWLEYLLPLIFLFPMAAMGGIVLALRSLHDARVHSPFDAPLREPGQALRHRLDQAFSSLFLNGPGAISHVSAASIWHGPHAVCR